MIGTKVKVGWDASTVQRGMKGLLGMMGRGFGAVARGGLERIGHRMTDLMGRIIAAAPAAIKDLADYGSELSDLSAALEIPVDRLMELQEAMRLGGAGVDALRMFATMAKNIEQANAEGGDLAKALQEIGLRTDKMAALKPDEQFRAIAEAIQQSELPVGKLIDVLSDVFGGRVGIKMLNLFREFKTTMPRAQNNARGFAKWMMLSASGLDEMSDALGRWEMFRRGMASIVVGGFMDAFGTGGIDRMFDRLDPTGIRNWFSKAFTSSVRWVTSEMQLAKSMGLGAYLNMRSREFGKWLMEKLTAGMNFLATEIEILTDSIRGKGFGIGEEVGRGAIAKLIGSRDDIGNMLSGIFDSPLIQAAGRLALSLVELFGTAVVELGKMAGGAFYGAIMEAFGEKVEFLGRGVPEMQRGMRMNQSWSPANATTMTTKQAEQLISLTKSIDRKFGGLATA